jgi:membrane protease YdiL (CAAX protease family)
MGAWQSAVQSANGWAFTAVLVVAFPIADWLLYTRSKSKFAIYAWNICAQWLLVAYCAAIFWRQRLKLTDLGEQIGSPLRMYGTLAALVAIFAVLTIVSRRQNRNKTEQVRKASEKFIKILPSSRAERAVYVVVAITAGLCEEFLYRGWLLHLLGAALGSIWVGLLLSSVAFGFAHIYQGRSGVISTGVLGIVFGLIVLVSGSLIPAQLLHVFIDIHNGMALGKIVNS